MARITTLGAENNTLTANLEWTSSLNGATISTNHPHTGTYSVRISSITSAANNRVSYQFASANATGPFIVRFYLYIVTLPSAENRFFRLQDSGSAARGYLTIDNTGLLKIGDEDGNITTGPTLQLNQHYQIEYWFDASTSAGTNTMQCRVNGGNLFGSTTRSVGTGVVAISLGANLAASPESQTTGDWYFDDIVINDSTGTKQLSWPAVGNVIRLAPNAAGDVNTYGAFTVGGTAGAANDFTRVNEVTPDDATTLNGSSTLGQEDLLKCNASGIPSNSVIKCVQVFARFRNGGAADTACGVTFEIEKASSGTKATSAQIVPNTTTWNTNSTAIPHNPVITLYADPDGSPWTQSTLDTMQIGYKLTANPAVGGRRVDVSAIWVLVDYFVPTTLTDVLGISATF
jgi:hypothetical protein